MSLTQSDTLFLRTCDYVTSHGKRDITDEHQDLDTGKLSWIIRVVQGNHKGSYRKEAGSQREKTLCC